MKNKFIFLFSFVTAIVLGTMFLLFGGESSPILYGKISLGDSKFDGNTKVFIVQGKDIFIDANSDGIPQASEQFANSKTTVFGSAGSHQEFQFTLVDLGVSPDLVSKNRPQKLIVYVDINSKHKYQMTGQLNLVDNLENAEMLRFQEPLEFMTLEELKLNCQNDSVQDLKIFLGNQSANPEIITVVVPDKNPPLPRAIIRYTGRDLDSTEEYVMDHFC